MEYESEDGWNLNNIYPLEEFVDAFDDIAKDIYELKNCIRTKSLVRMRNDLLKQVWRMQSSLKQINNNDKIVGEVN